MLIKLRRERTRLPPYGVHLLGGKPVMICAHCRAAVVLNPQRSRPRGHCRVCSGFLCDDDRCRDHCPTDVHTEDEQRMAIDAEQAAEVHRFYNPR